MVVQTLKRLGCQVVVRDGTALLRAACDCKGYGCLLLESQGDRREV